MWVSGVKFSKFFVAYLSNKKNCEEEIDDIVRNFRCIWKIAALRDT